MRNGFSIGRRYEEDVESAGDHVHYFDAFRIHDDDLFHQALSGQFLLPIFIQLYYFKRLCTVGC
jgi:hypothetical protein